MCSVVLAGPAGVGCQCRALTWELPDWSSQWSLEFSLSYLLRPLPPQVQAQLGAAEVGLPQVPPALSSAEVHHARTQLRPLRLDLFVTSKCCFFHHLWVMLQIFTFVSVSPRRMQCVDNIIWMFIMRKPWFSWPELQFVRWVLRLSGLFDFLFECSQCLLQLMHRPWLWHSDRYWRGLWWDFSSQITNLVLLLIVLNWSVRYLFLIYNSVKF